MTKDAEARRRKLRELLGDWEISLEPPERRGETTQSGAVVEDLRFRSSAGAEIPAYFARPVNATARLPAVIYCHAHGARYEMGRSELVEGRPALQSPWLGDLAALGLSVLCLEMPCFGERREPAESPLAKALLWEGRTLFGQMLAELTAGLDWLAADPRIDPSRIGVMGLSMGATHAFWLAALEPRLRASAHMCSFADLGCLIGTGNHDGHGIYMSVPGLLRHETTGSLAGLAAPRAQLACVGLMDGFTPESCFAPARAELERAYAAAGAAGMLEFHVEPDTAHVETPTMRARVREFLARRLVG